MSFLLNRYDGQAPAPAQDLEVPPSLPNREISENHKGEKLPLKMNKDVNNETGKRKVGAGLTTGVG